MELYDYQSDAEPRYSLIAIAEIVKATGSAYA